MEQLDAALACGPGGVGIAAPQLGLLRRVVLVDCRRARHPCRHHGRMVMINPEIIEAGDSRPGREGCLSVPDWVATVQRATRIRVSYLDHRFAPREIETTGFEARVIQHEIDHLDGILFIDRVTSTRAMVRRMAHRPR